MVDLLSLMAVVLGVTLVLIGLVMVANQVRVHQIRVYSAGAWVFRVGMILSLIGLLIVAVSDGPGELATLGLVTGGAGLLGALFTWNHEQAQALHEGAQRWAWSRSLTFQMAALAGLALLLALMGRI